MNNVTHIFFDLDHTLWDYEANAKLTLEELYEQFELSRFFDSSVTFLNAFRHHNDKLWHQYNIGKIDKDEIRNNRFYYILSDHTKITTQYSLELSTFFVTECPKKTAVVPGTYEILETLSSNYKMGIITNGFDDVQDIKLKNTNIDKYFDWVITSESTGYRKPSRGMYDIALQMANVGVDQVVMIGDNMKTDIAGAKAAGWKSIWYNPENESDYPDQVQIDHLLKLKELLQ